MKQPNTLPELLRHAADLAEKGESLKDKFEILIGGTDEWVLVKHAQPCFFNAKWRIADKEPATFEMKVGDKVFVLNKPYMSAPRTFAPVFIVDGGGAISKDTWEHGFSYQLRAFTHHNCWKTEADALAYAEAKLARDKFEIGEIK